MTFSDVINFLELEPNLFSGGQPSEKQLSNAAEDGVDVVINLALSTSTGSLNNEFMTVRTLGMEYIHIPVMWEKPTADNLKRFMDTMDARRGKKIFVHCAMNFRATAFIALYRILRLGWSHEKAFAPMYQVWNPADFPVWDEFIKETLES
ncbi:MAG TPA: protein tyrosine phosphatase family protein [Pseudomonadales bacterium]|nr:protein tyrosine phosphatase family protein [Pseudomonadales bacterium]